ncbi:VOC family protein [Actinopolymorpha sp. B17G11]|uniref:VOC family protein n=1 Tax=Actinopolymorpha sp. B17G11 TaxID=3160861 RepID=UPI0032E3695C
MQLSTLFHVAIKTADLGATRRFYVDLLGMAEDERPPLDFPGIWIRATCPGGLALFHIYAGDAATGPDGRVATGSGAVDHVSVVAHGYHGVRDRLAKAQVPWRENALPTIGTWQIFVHDPSGVLLELTFSAGAERTQQPTYPAERQYRPGEDFFDPTAYARLAP